MGLLEGVGGIWPPFLTSKKIPRDWAAAAAYEGGLSKSSCASHGAKQEDVVKNSGCRASKIPGKKQHSWFQKTLRKTALSGAERATSLLSGPLNRLKATLST